MNSEEIEEHVWKAISSTINKFREHPAYFFTESDITSYLYMRLYTSKLAVDVHDRWIYCVHREYPTNFRFERDGIIEADNVASLVDPTPAQRGNYDLVVLNPNYVRNSRRFAVVVYKSIAGLREHYDAGNSPTHSCPQQTWHATALPMLGSTPLTYRSRSRPSRSSSTSCR